MPTLMIQGTTSDAGKSTLVAGLCRVLARRGVSVAPFKPQNMALNSAVTIDGGEIGRAQALQAQACFLDAHTDMNPILLKPTTDIGAQVIIHGKVRGNMSATSYHEYKRVAMDAVMASHQRLSEQYDWVIVEGAGSPAEINLRENDIANMGFAEAADCPVIIVADIDKGGVFAHLYGTLALLSTTEQARVTGFVINRFRGDLSLLTSGLDWLEAETAKQVYGVLPYLQGLHLDAEDAITTEAVVADNEKTLTVVVPVLPRISNHTDFDPLRLHPQIKLVYVGAEQEIPPADLVVMPGSKAVRVDLAWLRKNGWDRYLARHLRYGGKVLGICGGYQMLGCSIADPDGIEGEPGVSEGLNYLQCETVLEREKILKRSSARLCFNDALVTGYEIHAGRTQGADTERPFLQKDSGDESDASCAEGALSPDGLVAGTYFHGLFDSPAALTAILYWAGLEEAAPLDLNEIREQQLERLADVLEASLDIDAMLSVASHPKSLAGAES